MGLDPARCPLCGGENACAMQADRAARHCWCESVEFSAPLLARVPGAARNRACICARCAAEGREGSEAAAQAR